jgi:hypothetical protein
LAAPETVWSLADAGFDVLAFGRKGRRSALCQSRYTRVIEVTPPEADARKTWEDIFAIRTHPALRANSGPVVFLPLDDAALCLSAQTSLPRGWLLAGGRNDRCELALDKAFQVEAARAVGLPVPDTWVATTPDEVFRCSERLPLVLKPAAAAVLNEGRLVKGKNWICANRAELLRAVKTWGGKGRLLVQPFITGVGEGVFGFSTGQGVVAWSAHRRVRMMNPHGSGSSACVSQPVPEFLKPPIERLVVNRGWRGLFMVELLREKSGGYWFIEFNGRPWGSLALSRRQGFEYPAWAVRQALDPAWWPGEVAPDPRRIVCRNLGREFMHVLFVFRGRKSAAIHEWPSFWRAAADVLRIRRQDHLYNFRRDDWRVFFSDCFGTIRDQCAKPRNRE